MAIVFELWAECATQERAIAFAHHFDGTSHRLLNGREITWHTRIESVPSSTTTGIVVDCAELSPYGVRSVQDVLETTEAGLWLYHRLKTAPPFLFARAAWESWYLTLEDLLDHVTTNRDGTCNLTVECAFDAQVYERLGSPQDCNVFRPGYYWKRYQGEQYQPLYSNDQDTLNAYCQSLFPDYFAY